MRRTLYRSRRRARLGMRGGLTLTIIVLAVVGVGLLSRNAGGDEAARLATHVRDGRVAPSALLGTLARSHRLLLLADIHTSPAAKRVAADAIDTLARSSGLDAVVLEVPSDVQAVIDDYLNTSPEDGSLLLASPRTLNGRWGTPDAYMALYHRVWRLNEERGAARRIRIIAADLPAWPPAEALSPRNAAELYARRDAYMAAVLDSVLLGPAPRARALVFMDGYHVLRHVRGELRAGGGERIPVVWLASRLQQRYGDEVATVLTDTGTRPGTALESVAAYSGTRAFALLQTRLGRTSAFGIPLDRSFAFLRDPVRTRASAGLTLQIQPTDYALTDVADGYIFLPGGN